MVKFKIGFTIDAETLFSLASKFMPDLHDLQVEEIYEAPPVVKVSKVAQLVASRQLPKPIRKKKSGYEFNIDKGVNKIIMDVLNDNQVHTYAELGAAVKKGGYAGTGIGSKLSRLKEKGFIFQPRYGIWQKKV